VVGLHGRCGPRTWGALLMLWRLRGETPERDRRLTAALRAHVEEQIADEADLKPAVLCRRPAVAVALEYPAGGSAGGAKRGYSISMHDGIQHPMATASGGAEAIDLAGLTSLYAAETLSPPALTCLDPARIRSVLRSCFNTVLRMWKPVGGYRRRCKKACFTLVPQPSSPSPRSFWARRN